MNPSSSSTLTLTAIVILWLTSGTMSAAGQSSPCADCPLYYHQSPDKQLIEAPVPANTGINLSLGSTAPAHLVAEAQARFDARTAAAVRFVASQSIADGGSTSKGKDGENYGLKILAKFAYLDYFKAPLPETIDYRSEVIASLRRPAETFWRVGTSIDNFGIKVEGDYDVLLTSYIALYYKYYNFLPTDLRDKLLHQLLTQRGPFDPGQRTFNVSSPIVSVSSPETENHLIMIDSARYLTNQLLYRQGDGSGRTHDVQYDNNRNGRPPMVDVVLTTLQSFLKHDFIEYNAKNYQDYTMVALLNLYSYAYDNRVKLAAGMVLDYISAKMAVSSNDLRRAVPYRRHNSIEFWGPCVDPPGCTFLNTPLVRSAADFSAAVDPQIAFYSALVGNTAVIGDRPPDHYGWGMVRAGLSDYRIPPMILDLFVNRPHRRFLQVFNHHGAIEAYAGSPSYLISAGGRPTGHAYEATVTFHVPFDPSFNRGKDDDLGFAFPTTFMPTATVSTLDHTSLAFGATTLDQLVQFDTTLRRNLCVSLDFACGEFTYFPPAFQNRHEPAPNDHWTFIDNSNTDPSQPSYFLALYQTGGPQGGAGLLDAYDTAIGGLTFQQFKGIVLANHGASLAFQLDTPNTYVTSLTSDKITFSVSPESITHADAFLEKPLVEKLAFGPIIDSDAGSARVTISNPALGPQKVVLDMHDQLVDGDPLFGAHHPSRRSESGDVLESAGANEEVWVDFQSPANVPEEGDFYHPFKTLSGAQQAVAVGGTIKIMPGSTNETKILNTKLILRSFPGSATIGRR